jgi:uncharacterized protein
MLEISWIWDEEKAKRNFAKHRVAFSEATLVFDDPLQLSVVDPHPDGDRWQTVGQVGPILLLVVHTFPVKWEAETMLIGRIISARPATSHERRAYEEGEF